jgi:hypothetical protein
MKGYPKNIATAADMNYLLKDPEYRDRALAELKRISTASTEKVTQAVKLLDAAKPNGEWETKLIDNPNPTWKQKGFQTAAEVDQAIAEFDAKAR